MISWDKLKPYSKLIVGIIGLTADIITILGTISVGRVLPITSNTIIIPPVLDLILLGTILLGFYSLTMIVWFLFQWRRSRQATKTFGFDEFWERIKKNSEGDSFTWTFITALCFLPLIGVYVHISSPSARIIFWLATFVALIPTTLWVYLYTGQLGMGCGGGLLSSVFLAQYSTYFALVLDKFVHSNEL